MGQTRVAACELLWAAGKETGGELHTEFLQLDWKTSLLPAVWTAQSEDVALGIFALFHSYQRISEHFPVQTKEVLNLVCFNFRFCN